MSPHVDRPLSSSFRSGIASRLAALVFALAGVSSAAAVPCASFTDVENSSPFCSSVEWVHNRGVTLGCTATQYCPGEAVTRLQMAAFLRRLGNALRPAFVDAQQYVSNIPGDGSDILCNLEVTPADVPRIATPSSVALTYHAGTGSAVFAGLVTSADQGQTWTPWSRKLTGHFHPGGGIGSQSPAAPPRAIPPGTSLRFGIQPLGSSGGPLIEDLDCDMTVRLDPAAD